MNDTVGTAKKVLKGTPGEVEGFGVDLDEIEAAAELRETLAGRLRDEANGYRQIATGLRALQGHVQEPPPEPTRTVSVGGPYGGGAEVPAGIEAVRRVMREGGVWTARQVLEELERRGWEPRDAKHPLPATEAAINRLYRVKAELERVGRGEYRYRGIPGSPTLDPASRRAEP